MRSTDRSILLGLLILGLLACFWFLLLAPKREQAGELETQVTNLQSEVDAQEQLAAAAEDAEADYGRNYERLIVLGKAAPADGDMPSLLIQLSQMSREAGTAFASLTAGNEAPVATPTPAEQTTTDQNAAGNEGGGGETATPAVAPAPPAEPTEAAASTLPLGATIGPAGLGVLPYTLTFSGEFFDVADLLESVDSQVGADGRATAVGGRLVTINGFTMEPSETVDILDVSLSISTYVLPDSQGLTAGATPVAPPASVPPATSVPTSTPTTP